eukprot:6475619-Amphidinium_carterae.3
MLRAKALERSGLLGQRYGFELDMQSDELVSLAQAAAIKMEATLISIVDDGKMLPETKRARLSTAVGTLGNYSKLFKQDVRKMMCRKVVVESLQNLLGQAA